MADSQAFIRAKAFRRRMTPPEARFWSGVRASRFAGLKFRRQHPIGPYIWDFYGAAARLAVEIDGATHADPDQARHDMVRTKWLAGRGIRVIRIAARDVRDEFDGVLRYLKDVITDRLAEADAAPS